MPRGRKKEVSLESQTHQRAFCPECGYDLRGCPPIHRCPECGFVYIKGLSTNKYRLSRHAWLVLPSIVGAVVFLPLLVGVASCYVLLTGPQVVGQFGQEAPNLVRLIAICSAGLAGVFTAIFVRNVIPDFRSSIHWDRKAIRWRVGWWRPEHITLWRMVAEVEIRIESSGTMVVLHIKGLGEVVIPERFYSWPRSAVELYDSVRRAWLLDRER